MLTFVYFGLALQWSDFGNELVGFSEPLIHMFNKNQSSVPVGDQKRFARKHALLLGDGLGDAAMVDGAASPPTEVLRVAFLNHADAAPHAKAYSAAFDVIVLAGGSFQPAIDVLAAVAGSPVAGVSDSGDAATAKSAVATTKQPGGAKI